MVPTSSGVAEKALGSIVGQNFSGVTFVSGGYLQLHFNPPPTLNAYAPVRVRVTGRTATQGDEGFANLLIKQLGKLVKEVRLGAEEVSIELEDEGLILVALNCDDLEAAELFGPDGEWLVFQSEGFMIGRLGQ